MAGSVTANHSPWPNGQRVACHRGRIAPGELVTVQVQPVTPGFTSQIYIIGSEDCVLASTVGWPASATAATPSITVSAAGGGEYFFAIASTTLGDYKLAVATAAPGVTGVPLATAVRKALTLPGGTASTREVAGEAPKPGTIIQDCLVCPKMVVVPGGSFMMGSPSTEEGRSGDEGPRRQVTFAHPFAVGAYEVTFAEWDACVAEKQCDAIKDDQGWGRGRRPVINVTKAQAIRYIAWLSDKAGHRYYLPSESEWEYTARAGADTPWNTGDALIGDDANILNTFKRSVPVGSFPPNTFGVHDMHGNVQEWVQDCGDVGYFDAPANGAAKLQPVTTCASIVRGGHWNSEPLKARSAYRLRFNPGPVAGGNYTGFRVTRALD